MNVEPTRKSKTEILQTLILRGWVPLRQAAVLLNYGELRGIYAKQRSRDPIPVIKIGGVYRIYPDDLFECMQRSHKVEPAEYEALKHLYDVGLRAYKRKVEPDDMGEDDG